MAVSSFRRAAIAVGVASVVGGVALLVVQSGPPAPGRKGSAWPSTPVTPGACALKPGARFSFRGEVEQRAGRDLTRLVWRGRGPRALPPPSYGPDAAQRFVLDLEVLETDARGALLAARVRGLIGAAQPGVDAPFRIRLDDRCGIASFGWPEAAPKEGVRQQQALVASLSFHLPGDHDGARYTGAGFDSTGAYRALYQWTGAALLARVLSYDRLFRGDREGAAHTRIDRSRLRVELASGQWLDRAERALGLRFLVGRDEIGGLTLTARYFARTPDERVPRSEVPWAWGQLLDTGVPDLALEPELGAALAHTRALVADAAASPSAPVAHLGAWLRGHAALVAALGVELEKGAFAKEPVLEMVAFHALAEAGTTEARAVLERLFEPKQAPALRGGAALALALLRPAPDRVSERLIALARAEGDDLLRGAGLLALGAFAAPREGEEPALTQAARLELHRLLEALGARPALLPYAIEAAGYAGGDEVCADLARLVEDKRLPVRESAAEALRGCNPDRALPALEVAWRQAREEPLRARLLDVATEVVTRQHRAPGVALVDAAAQVAAGGGELGVRARDLLVASAEAGDAHAQDLLNKLSSR